MPRGTRARRAVVVAERRNMNFDVLGRDFPAVRRTFEDYGTGSIGSLERAPAIFCLAQRSLSERKVIDGRYQQGEPDYDPIA
jgi:hypothetical protein